MSIDKFTLMANSLVEINTTEELIIRHCSPTLAGMKTGNLFSCEYCTEEMLKNEIRRLNRILVPKGIRVILLRYSHNKAMIYVYRPSRLKIDFTDNQSEALLEKHGYICNHPERCINQLARKLKECTDFPHEIGLFLGYPPEDVQGFIENKACNSKCVGHWKVYGDEVQAKTLFAKYKKCTEIYIEQWLKGKSVERLTVAV